MPSNLDIKFRDTKQTYYRYKYGLRIVFTVVILVFITIWTLKKITPFKTCDPKMAKLLEYINREMDRILKIKTREAQNEEFKKLKPSLPISPIRMTLTTAVFKYNGNSVPFALKRIIWNEKSGLEEDKMSMYLEGPHLVRTIDAFRTEWINNSGEKQTILWIFSEMLDVVVSQKYVKGDKHKIRMILRDILRGVAFLHSKSIAHLDLKICNVMGKKTPEGKTIYKLIDFGFSRKIPANKPVHFPGKNYGTFPYKAPEVMLSSLHGQKSDIWSIGAIAWYLSLEYTPFYRSNGHEKDMPAYKRFISKPAAASPKNHKFFFHKSTPPALRSFIMSCMRIEMDKRPTAEELLKHPFILGYFDYSDKKSDAFEIFDSYAESSTLDSQESSLTN